MAFLKEYPVILILIPGVWTEEMKLFALHISFSTELWFIHSFPLINKDYINVIEVYFYLTIVKIWQFG